MDLSHILSLAGGIGVGAIGTALVYRNNLAKVTALLNEICGHVLAGTTEEEAKILPRVKAFIAANLHL